MKEVALRIFPGLSDYLETLDEMEKAVERVINKEQNGEIWFVEYDNTYTAGSGAEDGDIKDETINIIQTNRGGKHTYHGPGQRVIYLIMDLHDIFGDKPDLHKYISMIEEWIINSLSDIGIKSSSSDANRGVWCGKNKVAAIGVRLRKWVSYHGVAINISTDLSKYENFIPCGMDPSEFGVTSVEKELGKNYHMRVFDNVLIDNFSDIFEMEICH